jgi:hypothetical protein
MAANSNEPPESVPVTEEVVTSVPAPSPKESAVVKEPVSITHPGVVAIGAYLFLALALCLWVFAILWMAQPAEDSNANVNTETDNSNGNTNSTNSNINSNVNGGNLSLREHTSRFVQVAYFQGGGSPSDIPRNVNNNSANPSPTAPPRASPTPKASPSQQNKIQGIPKKVRLPTNLLFPSELTGETYLLLIVIFCGLFGAGSRAIFSFFRHLGLGDFSFRWTFYYVFAHFGGAGLAVILYFVIRGGFYNPATVNGDLPLNPFSFAALGALAGLFSENAMLKLKMIAEVLLVKVEEKGNKPPKQ